MLCMDKIGRGVGARKCWVLGKKGLDDNNKRLVVTGSTGKIQGQRLVKREKHIRRGNLCVQISHHIFCELWMR